MLKTTTLRSPLLCRASRHVHRKFHASILGTRGLVRSETPLRPTLSLWRQFSTHHRLCSSQTPNDSSGKPTTKENIYTLPNLLTVSRIVACPVLGWSILDGNFHLATTLLVYAGLTDLVCLCISEDYVEEMILKDTFIKADGYLARRFNMQTVLGTILDPAADKTLMTTLTVTLAMQGLLPGLFLA